MNHLFLHSPPGMHVHVLIRGPSQKEQRFNVEDLYASNHPCVVYADEGERPARPTAIHVVPASVQEAV